MKIYLVGGAVRDMLLGKPVHDNDYVVVGGTISDMLDAGYIRVGNDFPVFLHPITRDEYALARSEVSTGSGYTDFEFRFTPDITLEEDLVRRDFTINAMCFEADANDSYNYIKLVDPLGGKKDLDNKIIRHISHHFQEDPLRVLRACRFAATLGFEIAEETIVLMKSMVDKGMLAHLTAERVWKEIEKALHGDFPRFIYYLARCDALKVVMPEVYDLISVPERIEYHPEGTAYNHTILCLQRARGLASEHQAVLNFMCLCHDFGKLRTQEVWPSHHNHDQLGLEVIDGFCDRLKVPNVYRDMAKLGCKHHMRFYQYLDQQLKTHYDMINDITGFKSVNKYKLDLVLLLHRADITGRDGGVAVERLTNCNKVLDMVEKEYAILEDKALADLDTEVQAHLSKFKGVEFGSEYRRARIDYLRKRL